MTPYEVMFEKIESGKYDEGEEVLDFDRDLFEAYGVTDNPKADKAYQLAYDYGHSAGFTEILSYFNSIVELIK